MHVRKIGVPQVNKQLFNSVRKQSLYKLAFINIQNAVVFTNDSRYATMFHQFMQVATNLTFYCNVLLQ